jgi:hypothetical protein
MLRILLFFSGCCPKTEVSEQLYYFFVMKYIDLNPVKAGLAASVGDWKASGAYYIRHNLSGMVDYTHLTRLSYTRLLPAP